MAYDVQSRMDTLGPRMKELNSETVTYTRGAWSTELLASLGYTEVMDFSPNGVGVQTRRQDFIITAVDLVLNGSEVLPNLGDRITRSNGQVYQVTPTESDDHTGSIFSYTTPTQKRLRVHTNRIS